MIQTLSKFYYGHTVTSENQYIDFKEGVGPQLTAVIDIGEYSLTDYLTAVALAMNTAGALTYTVSINRSTRIITISSTSAFTLLAGTGTNLGRGAWLLLGFSGDTSSATSHTASTASGSEWIPQFMGQDFVDFEDQQEAIDGVVRQSTSGKVEAVKFGNKKIMDVNFKFITDIVQGPSSPIENQNSGVLNARTFLEYATTKADLEFIPNRNNTSIFTKCILDSTSESKDGIGFKLKELYGQGLVGYYETGLLKFRKL